MVQQRFGGAVDVDRAGAAGGDAAHRYLVPVRPASSWMTQQTRLLGVAVIGERGSVQEERGWATWPHSPLRDFRITWHGFRFALIGISLHGL